MDLELETNTYNFPENSSTPKDLEETPEFKDWKQSKLLECLRYLKLSFNEDLEPERLIFRLLEDGYPDQDELRSHARIWGYNYKDEKGEIAVNPINGKQMTYVVWKVLKTEPTANPDATNSDFVNSVPDGLE